MTRYLDGGKAQERKPSDRGQVVRDKNPKKKNRGRGVGRNGQRPSVSFAQGEAGDVLDEITARLSSDFAYFL